LYCPARSRRAQRWSVIIYDLLYTLPVSLRTALAGYELLHPSRPSLLCSDHNKVKCLRPAELCEHGQPSNTHNQPTEPKRPSEETEYADFCRCPAPQAQGVLQGFCARAPSAAVLGLSKPHTPPSVQHMRKNQYEEALFRCEDDRFELDMAIECSQSAVKALTAVVEEVAGLDAEARERYRLDRSKVLSIHFRMVQKIYGTGPGGRLRLVNMVLSVCVCVGGGVRGNRPPNQEQSAVHALPHGA